MGNFYENLINGHFIRLGVHSSQNFTKGVEVVGLSHFFKEFLKAKELSEGSFVQVNGRTYQVLCHAQALNTALKGEVTASYCRGVKVNTNPKSIKALIDAVGICWRSV